jgi:hypothetical protein
MRQRHGRPPRIAADLLHDEISAALGQQAISEMKAVF